MPAIGAGGPPANYQTVRLSRGRHFSPEDGVCVMELASMLAAEPFSDRPRAVCPVVGAFLRAYNDRLDDRWRQDLYAYAAKVVGTRSTVDVERRRAQMCRDWIRSSRVRSLPPERVLDPPGKPSRLRSWIQSLGRERAARRAAIEFSRPALDYGGRKLNHELHRAALRFVDELVAMSPPEDPLLLEPDAMSSRHGPRSEGR